MNTIRQQLHTAVNLAEIAKADQLVADQRYQQARDRVNELIDKLCPLDAPDGMLNTAQLRAAFNARKIALIKLVREATSQYERVEPKPINGGCMGLSDAKSLVEEWIDDQYGRA